MRVTNLLLVPVLVLAACDLDGSNRRQDLSAEQASCSTECTAPCCAWAGGCENVDPYLDGCITGFAGQPPNPDQAYVVASGPINDFEGNQVGAVELRYSCSCQAWWTETVRYPTDASWYRNNYEIAASYANQDTRDRCTEPEGVGAYIDDGLTTYACHTNEEDNVIYNNTTTQWQPGACGWIRLKEAASDPDVDDVYRFENCGLCQGCSCNRPPDCSEAVLSHDLIFAEDHAEMTVCLAKLSDPDNNLADASGNIDITYSLSSSQPDDSTGDGNTAPDIFIEADPANPACVIVRAERKGNHRGDRVYTIEFTVTDTCGASCTGTRSVRIPHDHRIPKPFPF